MKKIEQQYTMVGYSLGRMPVYHSAKSHIFLHTTDNLVMQISLQCMLLDRLITKLLSSIMIKTTLYCIPYTLPYLILEYFLGFFSF